MDASEASFAGSFAGILLKKDQEIQILKEKLLMKTKDYEILKQLSVKCFRKSHFIASDIWSSFMLPYMTLYDLT